VGFSPKFLQFLSNNSIDPAVYTARFEPPRFVRVNPRNSVTKTEIEENIGSVIFDTPLPDFYRVDSSVKLAQTDPYKKGQIYGIDFASGMAVYALNPEPRDHVLDLCCAPGAKLCLLADTMKLGSKHKPSASGSVTGVDVSDARLSTCRTMIRKYKVMRCRLFLADGCSFSVPPPAPETRFNLKIIRCEAEASTKRARKRKRASSEVIQSSASSDKRVSPSEIKTPPPSSSAAEMYDKVMVDAQCTHDGSIKHILKYQQLGWNEFESKVLNPELLTNLQSLQRKLILNGFHLLKPGGVLVYSTCSFCRSQNEDIVEYLLRTFDDACLVPIEWPVKQNGPYSGIPGFLKHTVRFGPLTSGTSGLFVAKIKRMESPNHKQD